MSKSATDLARAALADLLQVDTSDFPDDTVQSWVENTWTGGWSAWLAHNRPSPTIASYRPSSEPLALRASIERLVSQRVRMGLYDTVTGGSITEDAAWLTIECHKTRIGERRDKITKSGLRLVRFDRTIKTYLHEGTGGEYSHVTWVKSEITVWQDEPGYEAVRFGAVNTIERFRDKMDQAETVWSPGTPRFPLDGDTVRYQAAQSILDVFGPGEL